MSIVETRKLSKNFDGIRAVDNLDLKVYPGETFGLLGPNGSGKTTTIRLLNCLIRPSGGSAMVKGFDISKDEKEIKAITGLLAESPGLYGKLTPVEFLEFVGALYRMDRRVLGARISELLDLFSLNNRKNSLVENFSTGMKQKLLIAASIIHDPDVLFLDEPISGLDPRAARVVKELIARLTKNTGKTIVISSHILSLVEELCDRIGIIFEGKLVAVGTITEILEQTRTNTLEEAFLMLTGGLQQEIQVNV